MTSNIERTWVELNPKLGRQQGAFLKFCRRIERARVTGGGVIGSNELKELRGEDALSAQRPHAVEEIKLRLVVNVILDLVAQGWSLKTKANHVFVRSPLQLNNSPADEKDRVRKGHLLERDSQLGKKAVADFVKSMERRRLTKTGWHSIFSVMRDGRELGNKLRQSAATDDEHARNSLLANTISPYIQFVEGKAVCEHTGLRLRDIWRYFRLTWVNSYKSTPGRSIMILIRDSSAPNHPVIGIAALGSSVVQQKVRDCYIGWDAGSFLDKLAHEPIAKEATLLYEALDSLIAGVYIDDLLQDAEIELEVKHLHEPTHAVVEQLRKEAKVARDMHHLNPHVAVHKSKDGAHRNTHWEQKARTMLFRSKRCLRLATLLSIRKIFQEHGFGSGSRRQLKEVVQSAQVRSAIGQLVRLIKAEHVGIDMMDITVCGALAPYNAVLGGKLICMLLCSPEVIKFYSAKYAKQASIIASSMKAAAVKRRHNLVLLCTTSLYGVGSSQYNRVRVPAEAVGGELGEELRFENLGYSVGFGSFHLSQETLGWIKFLLGRQGNRRVNSIFGEGVNPLMRKIRGALDSVGLPGDEILWHGNRRVIYAVPLAKNYREILFGLDKRAKYFMPQSNAIQQTKALADYWRKRWLSPRISRADVLETVSEHTLVHPIKHGARVLPTKDHEEGLLWDTREMQQG